MTMTRKINCTVHARSLLALALCLGGCSKKQVEPKFEAEPVAATPTPAAPVTPPSAPAEPSLPTQPSLMEAPAKPVLVRNPTSPDPLSGKFSLAQATQGLPKKGPLRAIIETDIGKLECKLYDDKAPNTVANFVGLARGLRPFWDAKLATWTKRPLFDGTSFHRAIPNFMIQGGDQLGDGSGEVGYVIPDEVGSGLTHDRAGLLCMANRGPNTNGGQFFITDAATPHLTQMGTYTIFGECTPLDLIARIARAPRRNPGFERPDQPVAITHVTIAR
ncbi:MAG: Peptidyl-prolyl cis-trans isomerase [Myxococcaceae bacterium]|nr:Peptidyl-prolyl cis-trans isomerase [Myxococcaceae bacterium]